MRRMRVCVCAIRCDESPTTQRRTRSKGKRGSTACDLCVCKLCGVALDVDALYFVKLWSPNEDFGESYRSTFQSLLSMLMLCVFMLPKRRFWIGLQNMKRESSIGLSFTRISKQVLTSSQSDRLHSDLSNWSMRCRVCEGQS